MKILHLAPEWKWSKIFIMPIVKAQIDSGDEVWLSTPNSELDGNDFYNHLNVVKWNKKYSDVLKYLLSILKVIMMVKRFNIKHIYAHTTVDSALYILMVRVFTSANITYINHGVPYIGYSGLMKVFLLIAEFINVNFSHKVITITESMKPYLIDINKTKKEIEVFEPGTLVGVYLPFLDYIALKEARSQFKLSNINSILRVIYVGRLEYRKGIYDLIEAINSTNFDCELMILGGESKDIDVSFDSSKVRFLGFQSDLSQYYLQADFLCVPSHHEGFGQVYLEAASYGVIPICCNIPGPTDFIEDGKNGFVVECQSPQSILSLFNGIYNNQFNLSTIRKNAFDSVLKYNASVVIKNNMELLK